MRDIVEIIQNIIISAVGITISLCSLYFIISYYLIFSYDFFLLILILIFLSSILLHLVPYFIYKKITIDHKIGFFYCVFGLLLGSALLMLAFIYGLFMLLILRANSPPIKLSFFIFDIYSVFIPMFLTGFTTLYIFIRMAKKSY